MNRSPSGPRPRIDGFTAACLLVSNVIGGGIDGFMMKKIADHAMKEFPRV